MSEPLVTDWLQTAAATLTFFAATAALMVAIKAPKAAAKWAEQYRSQSATASERENLRRFVFMSLMKCRRQMLHQDAITALNLIDVAFYDDRSVRDAYRSFIESTEMQPYNFERIVERYHAIIDKVSIAVEMSEHYTLADIRSGYYPDALSRLDEAAIADAEEKIARRSQ